MSLNENEDFVNGLLCFQLRPGTVTFANRSVANNHLDLGYEETSSWHRSQIVDGLLDRVTGFVFPDFLAPVPTGAVGWAEAVAERMDCDMPVVELDKLEKRKFAANTERLGQIRSLKGGLGFVLDDATTDGGTSEAYADVIEALGLKVAGIVSIFVRGKPPIQSQYPRFSLMERYIPNQLNWQKFQDEGKIVEL